MPLGEQAIILYRELQRNDCGGMCHSASAGLGCTLRKASSVSHQSLQWNLKAGLRIRRANSPDLFRVPISVAGRITVEVPAAWQIAGLPNLRIKTFGWWATPFPQKVSQGALHLTRKLETSILTMETKYYHPLQSFYQIVKAGGGEQQSCSYRAAQCRAINFDSLHPDREGLGVRGRGR